MLFIFSPDKFKRMYDQCCSVNTVAEKSNLDLNCPPDC